MATTTKQPTSSKPQPQANPDLVAAAEQAIAALERDRASLVAARAQDDAEMQKHAYAARVLHELGAVRVLSEIGDRAREHEQRLREIDAALVTARSVLKEAQAAEVAAVNRQKAAEAITLVKELGDCFPYLDRKLAEAANALIAINDGVQKLHSAGFQFPSDAQLRIGVAAIINTWAHRLPKHFHDQLRNGFEFLAPGRRQTAVEYWAKIQASIAGQISQRLGEGEQTKTEHAA